MVGIQYSHLGHAISLQVDTLLRGKMVAKAISNGIPDVIVYVYMGMHLKASYCNNHNILAKE